MENMFKFFSHFQFQKPKDQEKPEIQWNLYKKNLIWSHCTHRLMVSVTVTQPKVIYLHKVYVTEYVLKDNGTFRWLLQK